MADTKTLAIIDPVWIGHSPSSYVMYWRVLAGKHSASGEKLNLVGFSPKPEQTRRMLSEYGFADARIFHMRIPLRANYPKSKLGEARFAIAHWKSLRDAMTDAEAKNKTPIDYALIIWLDPFLAPFVSGILVDFLFRWPWAGLYLHPGSFRIKQSRRWRLLGKFIPRHGAVNARRCRAVLTYDEGIVGAMAAATKKLVLAFPDVSDAAAPDRDCDLAELIRRKRGANLVCGSIGVLAKRKGVLTLIEAAKAKPLGWIFVFAGGLSEMGFSTRELNAIQEFARSNPENCICWFRALPDEASFNAVISMCDVVYANYPGFPYSSGVVSKAALFKKPVIVSDRFLISERVAKFDIGWRLPEENVAALVDLLNHTDKQAVMSKQRQARFDDFNSEHSETRLSSVFEQLIAKMGN